MRRIHPYGVLVVERSAEAADALVNRLRRSGLSLRPRWASQPGALAEMLRDQPWDLLLVALDAELPSPSQIMEVVQRSGRDVAVIGVSRGNEPVEQPVDLGDDALRAGFHDVVAEAAANRLEHAVTRELQSINQRRKLQDLRSEVRGAAGTLREIMHASAQGIALVHDGHILHVNPAWLRLFGVYSGKDPRGLPLADFVTEAAREGLSDLLKDQAGESASPVEVELDATGPDGETMPLRLEISKARFEGRRCALVIACASAETITGETGGQATTSSPPSADRRSLIEAANAAARGAGRDDADGVFLCLWIENHAMLVADFGLGGADALMQELRARIAQKLPDDALLCTVTDDTIGVFLPQTTLEAGQGQARLLADAIARDPVRVGAQRVRAACAPGVATLSDSRWNPAAALDSAYTLSRRPAAATSALSLQATPERGVPVHDEALLEEIAGDLSEAMSDGRLSLVFQPIVRLRGEPIELYEAFLRLKNRHGEPVPTPAVIAAADRADLDVELDVWVIQRAVTVLDARRRQERDTHLFVKLSDRCMGDIRVPLTIGRALKGRESLGSKLIIEVSETAASGNLRAARAFIQSLEELGCPAALDHFGLSLAAFQMLEDVPANYLKLDATLVNRLAEDAQAFDQVSDICARAAELGKHTIASYLDNPRSLAKLYQAGVEFAQGYYIQEPSESMDYEFSILVE